MVIHIAEVITPFGAPNMEGAKCNSTITQKENYVDGYTVGCEKTESTIEKYKIDF